MCFWDDGSVGIMDQEFLGKNVFVALAVLVFPEGEFLGVLLR